MRTLEAKAKSYSPPLGPAIGCGCHGSTRPTLASHRCKVFLVRALRPTLDTRVLARDVGIGKPVTES